MANFQEHLLYGVGVSSVCALVGYFQFDLTKAQSGATLVIGTLASLAPDLDHPRGIPGKVLSDILSALIPIAFLLYIPMEHAQNFALEHWILLFFAAYISVRYVSLFLLDKLTVHRGIFHSFPAAIICGQIVFLLFSRDRYTFSIRLTIAIIGMLGYLTHLIADEFYSINWDKIEAKRSLGSAIDIGNIREIPTWVAYGMIAVLGWIMWQQYHPASLKFFG